MITEESTISEIIEAFKYTTSRGWKEGWWEFDNVRVAFREMIGRYLANIPPYKGSIKKRGVVICAGGEKLLTCAWVCVRSLRFFEVGLPIQIWYLGKNEVDSKVKSVFREFDVEFVNAFDIWRQDAVRVLNGWELKPFVLKNCSFSEVLFLDADNMVVKDPTYLFDSVGFRRTGVVFWPDFGRLAPKRAIWKILGISYRDEPEVESGQILLDREKVWRSLCLTMFFNEYSDYLYRYIHGDKETFHLAFRLLRHEYAMPSRGIHALEGTMCQHDFLGQRVFQHRNMLKWCLNGANKKVSGFLLQDECNSWIEDLKQKWDGRVLVEEEGSQDKREESLLIRNGIYCYERVGFDKRDFEFGEGGTFKDGGRRCEQEWKVLKVGKEKFLWIYGEKGRLTCVLKKGLDEIWYGRWERNERMPIKVYRRV